MPMKHPTKDHLGDARYTITQSFTFDSSHKLKQEDFSYLSQPFLVDLSKCFYDHGHTYYLEVEWQGFPTEAEPMIWPFGHLKSFTQTLVSACDHSNLNHVFVFPTTLENVANWFFKRLLHFNCDKLKLRSVLLREGRDNKVKVEAL